jgi:hypothetical protein
MPRRRSNLGRRTRKTEAFRRVRATQTEEQRASANERHRQRMVNGKQNNLYIFTDNGTTKNIVYQQALSFLFPFISNSATLSHSEAWPGTASCRIYVYIHAVFPSEFELGDIAS